MHILSLAISSGLLFAAWQLLSRTSSVGAPSLNIAMYVSGLAVAGLYGAFAMKPVEWQSLATPAVWVPLLCGIFNGVGFVLYMIAMQKSPSLTSISMSSMMSMIGFIGIGGVIFFNEPITWEKIGGLGASVAAVYLLSK